ncbi:HPr family phosphocarrier protein [Mycoplasmatota bacterium zrk1]
MLNKRFRVLDELGIHARPASLLVAKAQCFESTITVTFNEKTKDLKSLLGLMTMVIKFDDTFTISCEGTDEIVAMESIVKLLINERICEECQI